MNAPQPPPERTDRGSMVIAAAIIGAALVLSWGMSSSQPRYELAASGDTVVRMDTDSGEMIACNRQRCGRVEPPQRAKTFGPLTFEFDDSEKAPALPAPNANEAAPTR